MRSIRRTLLATLLGAVTVVTLAAASLVYGLARQQIDAIFDYQLRQLALTLRGPPAGKGGAPEDLDFVLQIWDPTGLKLYDSRPNSGLPASAQLGFATVRSRNGEWRVYTRELAGLVVQVAQPLRVREKLAIAASLRFLAPVLLILPLLGFLVWRSVGRALAPLDQLAEAVGSRTTAALEPLPVSDAPEEALPLVRSLNDLLNRLRAALDAQRAFVADAAHGLRTPLAALNLQLQLVERASDSAERAAALAALRAGLERATHLVQQLLTLARAEPDAVPALAGEPVRLADLVEEAIADHAIVAETKGVDLGATEVARDAVVGGDRAALRTLLANRVENAIRYTPRGGRVDVAAGRPWLEVVDNGPESPGRPRAFRSLLSPEHRDARKRARSGDRQGHRRSPPCDRIAPRHARRRPHRAGSVSTGERTALRNP
jgi:two-component system OmpR family sensor kinase